MAMPRTTAASLFAKCDCAGGPDACWIWQGRVSRRYGVISMNDHPTRAHRAAWMLTRGAIPAGLVVRHDCDQPLCCNPRHLRLGTVTDNNRDCVLRGRQARGERVAGARLTEANVKDIRRRLLAREKRSDIAAGFGIAQATVYAIQSGRIWKHLIPGKGV